MTGPNIVTTTTTTTLIDANMAPHSVETIVKGHPLPPSKAHRSSHQTG